MGKGELTKERILDHAMAVASVDGLEGLTIGRLSQELSLSKSGLFAHFGSKEALQLEVITSAQQRFIDTVVRPAFQAARGLPRIRSLFDRWLAWDSEGEMPGGCLLIQASVELDDRPGPLRDALVQGRKALLAAMAKSARLAIEEGHFRKDLDVEQFAFEMNALVLGYHNAHRLLGDPKATKRAKSAFERIIADAKV